MENTQLIILEGMDYSGKSSLAKELSGLLSKYGNTSQIEELSKLGDTRVLNTLTKFKPSKEIFSMGVLNNALNISRALKECDKDYLILDRYLHSSIVYQGYNDDEFWLDNDFWEYSCLSILKDMLPEVFNISGVINLTISEELIKERFNGREKVDDLDKEVYKKYNYIASQYRKANKLVEPLLQNNSNLPVVLDIEDLDISTDKFQSVIKEFIKGIKNGN